MLGASRQASSQKKVRRTPYIGRREAQVWAPGEPQVGQLP